MPRSTYFRAVVSMILVLTAAASAVPPADGDLLVASRSAGAIVALDPDTAQPTRVVSGVDLFDPTLPVVGSGDPLDGAFDIRLYQHPGGADVFAWFTRDASWGIYRIDVQTGDRTLLPGTDADVWEGVGTILPESETTFIALADNFIFGPDGSFSRVLRYDLVAGTTEVVSSELVGDGPVFQQARAAGWLVPGSLLAVVDQAIGVTGPIGRGLFTVDIATGDRRFVSRLSPFAISRQVYEDGAFVGPVVLGDGTGDTPGGEGPVFTSNARDLVVLGGDIFLGFSTSLPAGGFAGGILRIDARTGDRRLAVGTALADNGLGDTTVERTAPGEPSVLINDAAGLIADGTASLSFVSVFGGSNVFGFSPTTGSLVRTELPPATTGSNELGITDMIVYDGSASDCPADFVQDGQLDFFDIQEFLAAFAAGCP